MKRCQKAVKYKAIVSVCSALYSISMCHARELNPLKSIIKVYGQALADRVDVLTLSGHSRLFICSPALCTGAVIDNRTEPALLGSSTMLSYSYLCDSAILNISTPALKQRLTSNVCWHHTFLKMGRKLKSEKVRFQKSLKCREEILIWILIICGWCILLHWLNENMP